MLLAIDIGNTSVSFGLFDNSAPDRQDKLLVSSKVSVQKNRDADEYAVLIKQILDMRLSPNGYSVDCVAISSVVPTLTAAVADAAEILSGHPPYMIEPGIRTGFKIAINDPACLGSDIVSNTVAAFQICDPPFVIFDAGTANTITVVDESCDLVGTIIMPGVRISAEALNENAELLDTISLNDKDLPLVGKNTEQSVRSGLILGNSIMLDGFVRNIRESIIPKDSEKKLGLVATGEFARLVTERCRNKFTVDDSLTLRGIAALYYRNVRK